MPSILESLTQGVESESSQVSEESVEFLQSLKDILEESQESEKTFEEGLLEKINDIIAQSPEGGDVGQWVKVKELLESGNLREMLLAGESPFEQSLVFVSSEVNMLKHYLVTEVYQVLVEEGFEVLERSAKSEVSIENEAKDLVQGERATQEKVVVESKEFEKKLEEVAESLENNEAQRLQQEWSQTLESQQKERNEYVNSFGAEYQKGLLMSATQELTIQKGRVREVELRSGNAYQVGTYLQKRMVKSFRLHEYFSKDSKEIADRFESMNVDEFLTSENEWEEILESKIPGGEFLLREIRALQEEMINIQKDLQQEQEASRILEEAQVAIEQLVLPANAGIEEIIQSFQGIEGVLRKAGIPTTQVDHIRQWEQKLLELDIKHQAQRDEHPIHLIHKKLESQIDKPQGIGV